MILPKWDECRTEMEASNSVVTNLEKFIYNYEPSGDDLADAWRRDLQRALNDMYRCSKPDYLGYALFAACGFLFAAILSVVLQ